ncbi:MAG TPA: hypothetical protein VM487_21515 [Phycisphaerae bacterium]|nr:hypothetical protein [Phycisphaerae bacterium]
MVAQVDQQTFFVNLILLVALLIVAVVGFVVLVASWTGLKIGIWHFRRKRAEREEQQRKQRPEDKASLPVGHGLCDRCGTPSREVFHLPSGERCCPECFQQFYAD